MSISKHHATTDTQSNRNLMRAAVATLAILALLLTPLAAATHEGEEEAAPAPETTEGQDAQFEAAQPASCTEDGMNVQCTEFGTIKMDSRRDIRGEPLDVAAQIQLNTAYADQGARWVMFSVRNVTSEGESPVTIGLGQFSTSNGDIVTTRVEQVRDSELNLWVDVLDLPIGIPISLALRVGATERGAFSLETLVLAFDRGYAPVKDAQGLDASLFSFTLLGVNKESSSTAGDGEGSLSTGNKLPTTGAFAALAVIGFVAMATVWRRRA